MKTIKENFINFIKDYKYIVPVIITVLLSFGFLFSHYTINIDTLAYDRYFLGNELLCQSRFFAPLFESIFHILSFNPFFIDFLAVLLYIVAATLICSFMKKITDDKLHKYSYTIFTCLFISYPLLPEIFTYTPAGFCQALAYIMCTLSTILLWKWLDDKNVKKLIFAVILLICSISLYESFASVYLVLIAMTIILELLYKNDKFSMKTIFIKILKLLLPLVIAIILNAIIANSIIFILDLTKSTIANKTITYTQSGLIFGIKRLIITAYDNFFIAGIYYLPITIFVLSTLLTFVLMFNKNKNKFLLIFCYLFLLICVVSLSIIQGTAATYRTCQTFALFIAFIIMLTYCSIPNKLKKFKSIILVLISLIVLYQAKDMHNWFYLNHIRYETEKSDIVKIGQELSTYYDLEKPVLFVGYYGMSNYVSDRVYLKSNTIQGKLARKLIYEKEELLNGEYVKKIGQTNINSCLEWQTNAFSLDTESNVELMKSFSMYGFNLKNASKKILNEKEAEINNMPSYPRNGYIKEFDDCIIVKF